jgi:DegV family protein with EDD domain
MSRPVALVTDSTAMLSPPLAEAHGVTVVPLQVVVGAQVYDDGLDPAATPETIAAALREWTPVSTSRPSPAAFLEVYEKAAADGAEAVLSMHLSGEMSGTFESAQLAARDAPIPVHAVDTRQLGVAVGLAVLTAADVLDAGGSVEEAAAAARSRSRATTSLFYVDTLEYLRRGGRIGSAAALLGSALSVKPLLGLVDGRIETKEKVRTSARALNRLADLAVAAAGSERVDVAVAHLAAEERAETLRQRLAGALEENLEGREVLLGEVGAVIGAHVGPGMVAVVVAPRPA